MICTKEEVEVTTYQIRYRVELSEAEIMCIIRCLNGRLDQIVGEEAELCGKIIDALEDVQSSKPTCKRRFQP